MKVNKKFLIVLADFIQYWLFWSLIWVSDALENFAHWKHVLKQNWLLQLKIVEKSISQLLTFFGRDVSKHIALKLAKMYKDIHAILTVKIKRICLSLFLGQGRHNWINSMSSRSALGVKVNTAMAIRVHELVTYARNSYLP